MTKQELFAYYYNLMSKEMREEIAGYENFIMNNKKVAIKVNFKNGSWIRVYKNIDGSIEWY